MRCAVLSTEILAGKGPDVLVLDGMPVDSYIDKGILSDLAPMLDEKINSSELLPNVANTFRRDMTLYAIPARFSVPMIHGDGLADIHDLASLAEWAGKQSVKGIGVSPKTMMQRFYETSSNDWFKADGSLDEAKFKSDLEALETMAAAVRDEENIQDNEGVSMFGALFVKMKATSINFAPINAVTDLAPPYSAMDEIGSGEIKFFPDRDGGVFIPRTVLGINDGTTGKALAGDFVSFVLSKELLSLSFDDGLPVNEAALSQNVKDKAGMQVGSVGSSSEDPETGEVLFDILTCQMPAEDIVRRVIDNIGKIDQPVIENAVVKAIIIAEATPYLNGEKSLEDTMQSLRGKLALYLSE